ncbi:MAG: NADH-quinone oxidoreductase subunit J [Anaeromusa sp.]|jgi:NADH:ubiquinone oxidoreductase subunit 6 (subunit J)|uniref:NADH-quinone oxidoreductase subunit J family protein n=1 Tax=Anaeromusa sp. TaxID=1872520 RepID=UPI0026194D9A|nr:NADH-quinone oxidoreductase subunit J [Anaeromusa sp.]MDD3158800.1 NADH-quinone oxidoreductase subunit J [Anaeromusa sp.]MEA4836238.1 NADH-quinone oxidoreductase subunit J [Anaeromusa sp.]NCB76803.1 NADH-quinone oxidoreductase subunit J [Negativicutes bacterium]
MSEWAYTIAFFVFASITVAAAFAAVSKTNLVHSALFLALCFIGVSGLYVLLQADFMAAVQILIYNGAIAIVFVLGTMLTRRSSYHGTNATDRDIPSRLVLAVSSLFVVITMAVIATTPWRYSSAPPVEDTPSLLGQLILTDYMVAMEVAAVLLLAAMIGSIVLAKGVEEE